MIKIINTPLPQSELLELCQAHFDTMVKFVADIAQKCMAIGGELHADAEALLLAQGSRQSDLWGGNFFPWNASDERIEFTSFINIRPSDDNPAMEILNTEIRRQVIDLAEKLLLAPAQGLDEAAS